MIRTPAIPIPFERQQAIENRVREGFYGYIGNEEAVYAIERVTDTKDGTFDSKREYARWCDLKNLQRAGEISDLRRQVRYPLIVNGVKVCTYVADFVYVQGGATCVEDSKGVRTQAYVVKRKLMLALHSIDIKEV
jgi:hypothetical protein